jgi:hypothetical protein
VRVLPANAPFALTGSELDEIADDAHIELWVCEAGARSAAQLWSMPNTIEWRGRWEVLTSDAPDAPPNVVLRRLPTGSAPAALGPLPTPLPDELFVRFVPELHKTAFTAPLGASFAWGRTTIFRLQRHSTAHYDDCRVVQYRSAP